MTSELDQSLPPELDASGEKVKQPRNTSIGMLDYFSTIERLCKEKDINPENLEHFFKVHWLRNAVGGSFKRSQEMFEKYIHYVETVPEEARVLAIPKGITTAVDDLMSLITWYYRMSYEDIQSDKVKELVAHIQTLQTDIGDLEARHRVNEGEIVHHKDAVRLLTAELDTCNLKLSDVTLNYEQTREDNLTLEQQREKAQTEADRLQLVCDSLTNQLAERRQELSSQQEYLKQLVSESKTQQGEISSLVRERDTLKATASDLTAKLGIAATTLSTLKSDHAQELNAAVENCAKTESKFRTLEERCESVTTEFDLLKAKHKEASSQNENLFSQLREKSQLNQDLEEGMMKLKEELLNANALLAAEKTISANMKETISMLSGAVTQRPKKQEKTTKAGSKNAEKP